VTKNCPARLDDILMTQGNVLTRAQALAAGLSPEAIRERLSRGRWQRIYPGIYAAFTGQIGRTSELWAAVLHAGPGAALSHETAAEVDGLRRRECTAIHVTVPAARHVHPVRGLVIHRTDRVTRARHPTRTPPRTRIEETVLDLTQAARTLDDACDWLCRACGGRFTTSDRILGAMALRKKLRWRADLTAVLSDVADGAHSLLELRYVRQVQSAHGLPHAKRQKRAVRGKLTEYRDNVYDEYGVGVETDGMASHPVATRWLDISRDNAAAANGIVTLRYSWSDITTSPCQVAGQVAAVLNSRGWPGTARRCGPTCTVMSSLKQSPATPASLAPGRTTPPPSHEAAVHDRGC
jgi:hypothetical protein